MAETSRNVKIATWVVSGLLTALYLFAGVLQGQWQSAGGRGLHELRLQRRLPAVHRRVRAVRRGRLVDSEARVLGGRRLDRDHARRDLHARHARRGTDRSRDRARCCSASSPGSGADPRCCSRNARDSLSLQRMSGESASGRRLGLALVLGLVVLQLARIGGFPLQDPDEGRYAEIAREMLESGDFVTPRLNYVVYFEKPPLVYWLVAASMATLRPLGSSRAACPRHWPRSEPWSSCISSAARCTGAAPRCWRRDCSRRCRCSSSSGRPR